MITSEILRAARALLRWDQAALAEASGVALSTIKRLEAKAGELGAHGPTIQAIRLALESNGVTIVEGNPAGVLLEQN